MQARIFEWNAWLQRLTKWNSQWCHLYLASCKFFFFFKPQDCSLGFLLEWSICIMWDDLGLTERRTHETVPELNAPTTWPTPCAVYQLSPTVELKQNWKVWWQNLMEQKVVKMVRREYRRIWSATSQKIRKYSMARLRAAVHGNTEFFKRR